MPTTTISSTWTSIAQEVRDLVVRELAGRPRAEIARAVEQAAVVNSVRNLLTFRWIAEKVAGRHACRCTPGGST